MKNLIYSLLAVVFFSIQLHGQAPGKVWYGKGSGNAQAEAVHKALMSVVDDFANGNSNGWKIYTDDATEIDPNGNITFGKKAMLDAWDAFMKMVDEKPKFTYSNVLVRMLTNDIAIAVFETSADIKIKGQQIGGKAKGSAVLRKHSGVWKIEFDQLTPEMAMPEN